MQWYFLSETQEQVPIQEAHLPQLIQTGVIKPQTMIWQEGMEDWVSCSEIKPELFSAPTSSPKVRPITGGAAPTVRPALGGAATAPMGGAPVAVAAPMGMDAGDHIRELVIPLYQNKGWIKFFGIFSIIYGIITIPMLFLGVLQIIAGVKFLGAVKGVENTYTTGQKAMLLHSQRELASGLKLYGIHGLIMLIMMLLTLLSYGLLIGTVVAAIGSGAGMEGMGGMEGIDGFDFPETEGMGESGDESGMSGADEVDEFGDPEGQ